MGKKKKKKHKTGGTGEINICYSQSLKVCSLQLNNYGFKQLSQGSIHSEPDYFCIKHIEHALKRVLKHFFLL